MLCLAVFLMNVLADACKHANLFHLSLNLKKTPDLCDLIFAFRMFNLISNLDFFFLISF